MEETGVLLPMSMDLRAIIYLSDKVEERVFKRQQQVEKEKMMRARR